MVHCPQEFPSPTDGTHCNLNSLLTRFVPVAISITVGLLYPALCIASGGDSGHDSGHADDSLGTVVALVLAVGCAYLLTHFVVDVLQRRFLLSTNVEYVLLGVLLGPTAAAVPGFEDLTPIAPLIALAAGWIGLLYGMELELQKLLTTRNHSLRLSLMDGAGVILPVVFAAQWFFQSSLILRWLPQPIPTEASWLGACVLGFTAWAGSSDALSVVKRQYNVEGPLVRTLRQTAHLGDMLAIAAMGFLFCAYHESVVTSADMRTPTSVEWGVITIAIGALLGGLFTVFIGKDTSEDHLLLPLAGIITFAAGAAFFLDLSPLLINLVLGAVLANTAAQGMHARKTLEGTVRPISLILLVFAGVLWSPPALWPTVIASVGLIVLRVTGKMGFVWLATLGTNVRRDAFRGLVGQGHVAVAMALSFKLVFHGPVVDITYTAILVSVIFHELLAPYLLKGLLVDAGIIRREARVEA